MKKILKLAVLLFLLVLFLTAVSTPAESWKELLDQADSLSEAANQDSAIVIGNKALELAEREFGTEDTTVALILNLLGICNDRKANYDQAESLYNRALAIREKVMGPEDPRVAATVHNLGVLYWERGEYAAAESLHSRALGIREKTLGPDHLDVAKSLNGLGIVYFHQGRFGEAEVVYKKALSIKEEILGSDHLDVARTLINLAITYAWGGKYSECEPLGQRALSITEKIVGFEHPYVAYSLDLLANFYVMQGRYAQAEPLYKRSLAVKEKNLGPNHPDVASSLNNLAILYYEQGRYAEAEPLLKRSIAINEKTLGSEHPGVAYSLNGLGNLYRLQSRYAEAEPLYERALVIQEKALGSEHTEVARILNNLAILHTDQGIYAKAEPLIERSIKIKEKVLGSEHPEVAHSLEELANVYSHQEKYEQAEALYRRTLVLYNKGLGSDHPNTAGALESFSKYYRLQKDAETSLEMGEKAFEIRQKNFWDNAYVLSEEDALTYSQQMLASADNYLSCYFNVKLDEESLAERTSDIVLASKGQVSDEIFGRQKSLITETDSTTLALAESLRYTRFQLSQLFIRGPGDDTTGAYRHQLDSLGNLANELESSLARHSVSFRKRQDYRNISVGRVASLLPEKCLLVEYLKYDYDQLEPHSTIPRYLAVVVTGDEDPVIIDLGDASQIDPLIDQYRRHLLSVSSSDRLPSIVDQIDYEKIAKSLYDKIWKPVEKQILEKDLVLIAPDGGLNMVSFAGLIDDEGEYLIEKYPIHYLSSGRDLIRLKDETEPGSGLFALGDPDYNATALARLSIPEETPADSLPQVDYYTTRNVRSGCGELKDMTVSPLPWTKSEVEKITEGFRKSLNEPVVAYFGADASEEHFKSEAPRNRVIHLATHGYFIQGKCQVEVSRKGVGLEENYVGENPLLLSGLFLAGANLHGEGADSLGVEDGILTAEEVTAINLDGTDLVVLSACETGLGEVKEGEGVYGLRRAFQMAGARTVISALWPVSDKATAEMMSKLYERKIESLPERIRKLQLEKINQLRNQKKPDHPLSWGAFIALGDWR